MHCACAVLYCRLWPGCLHLSLPHYLINGMIPRKKELNVKCVFWCSVKVLYGTFFFLRRIQRNTIIRIPIYLCQVPSILVWFEWNLTDFRKILKWGVSSFIIIRLAEADCSRRADGRTGIQTDRLTDWLIDRLTMWHDIANSLFRNSTNATKKKFYFLPMQCICVFRMALRTNSDYFPVQH